MNPQRRRHYALSAYFRQLHGLRVQKIPLDSGADCPNRDGTLSRRGCAFCNPRGSGTGLLAGGMDLAAQWEHWRKRYGSRGRTPLFYAYLQSYTNTYGPASRLQAVLEELSLLPGLSGLFVGTRPDCLDMEKIDLLAGFPVPRPGRVWLELGLQSSKAETLQRINRGHGPEIFARAARLATEAGLLVCAHVVAGLPGESGDDFLSTVATVNELPVHGVKFHNLYVCKGSTIAEWWRRGDYGPQSREEYVDVLGRALSLLRPDIVVHRLAADPAPGELLAPSWAGDKQGLRAAIDRHLADHDILQGRDSGAGTTAHWDPEDPLPSSLRRPASVAE